MQQTRQSSTYIPEIQKRLMRYCSRIGIRCDMVTFLGYREVKIMCGKRPPTIQSARAVMGFIPYMFRKIEGLNDLNFQYRFEGNFCYIEFKK